MSEIEYLDDVERQLQQARARVTTAKNKLIEAIDNLNELQMSLNQRRIILLKEKKARNQQ